MIMLKTSIPIWFFFSFQGDQSVLKHFDRPDNWNQPFLSLEAKLTEKLILQMIAKPSITNALRVIQDKIHRGLNKNWPHITRS